MEEVFSVSFLRLLAQSERESVVLSSAGTKRVHNNIIYNEYISDRQHIHMNATRWETLTDFTKWLGREGERPPGRRRSDPMGV